MLLFIARRLEFNSVSLTYNRTQIHLFVCFFFGLSGEQRELYKLRKVAHRAMAK